MPGEEDEQLDIEQAALDPKSMMVDGVQVTGHSLKELIEADRYLTAKKQAKSRKPGFRLTKIVPPGTA